MSVDPRAFARSRTGRSLWWAIAILLAAAAGASPPEVVRVRVPAGKVSSWFPPGSDLRVLPHDRFEALVKAASDRPSPSPSPRLLKARHSARWEAGRLLGKTELTVEPRREPPPALLILEPWSPAIVDRGPGSKLLRAASDGRLGLLVAPDGPTLIEFEWTLRPGRARRGGPSRSTCRKWMSPP